jgi:hypothetical protein
MGWGGAPQGPGPGAMEEAILPPLQLALGSSNKKTKNLEGRGRGDYFSPYTSSMPIIPEPAPSAEEWLFPSEA